MSRKACLVGEIMSRKACLVWEIISRKACKVGMVCMVVEIMSSKACLVGKVIVLEGGFSSLLREIVGSFISWRATCSTLCWGGWWAVSSTVSKGLCWERWWAFPSYLW